MPVQVEFYGSFGPKACWHSEQDESRCLHQETKEPICPDTANATYESRELNEILSWKETQNSIRLRQSESLSKIVSSMESTRSR